MSLYIAILLIRAYFNSRRNKIAFSRRVDFSRQKLIVYLIKAGATIPHKADLAAGRIEVDPLHGQADMLRAANSALDFSLTKADGGFRFASWSSHAMLPFFVPTLCMGARLEFSSLLSKSAYKATFG